jgi:hypothetical protein
MKSPLSSTIDLLQQRYTERDSKTALIGQGQGKELCKMSNIEIIRKMQSRFDNLVQ